MATTLTIPEKPITFNAVTSELIIINYNADGTPDLNSVYFQYSVRHYNSDGDVVKTIKESIPFSEWPASFKADVKAVHNKVIIDAKNKGYIGTGVDSEDIP